jgi:hypothetical protein
MIKAALPDDMALESLLRECVDVLQQVADYRLPPALDNRLLWLSENKEKLDESERGELFAIAEFAEERTLEKVRARAALKRLGEAFPDLMPARS